MTSAPAVPTGTLEGLSGSECRRLLGVSTLGRIAFVVEGQPVILPVNYRLLDDESGLWILLRTSAGSAIDDAPERVAFEIDGVDYTRHQGWSVLVRGVLHHLDHHEIEMFAKRFDPEPWPQLDLGAWIAIKSRALTGRRLHSTEPDWAFSAAVYR